MPGAADGNTGCAVRGTGMTAAMGQPGAVNLQAKLHDSVLQFSCHGATLFGILSAPVQAATRGVLVVVGGPQYRAGSHRQFTLLARDLAARGVPVLRFDYRGMGDSEGAPRSFTAVGDDLRAAIDAFFRAQPTLESVVLWGLCDGACAALLHAPDDARVSGLVLLNPWVRTEAGQARTQLKHYYLARLMALQFWLKIVRGRFDYAAAARSLRETIASVVKPATAPGTDANGIDAAALPEKMRDSLARFNGRVLLILSGQDLTAKEFLDTVARSGDWQKMLRASRVTRHDLTAADHTFSRRAWRDQVTRWTAAWLGF